MTLTIDQIDDLISLHKRRALPPTHMAAETRLRADQLIAALEELKACRVILQRLRAGVQVGSIPLEGQVS
jgi:hypothetical protein